MKERDLRVLCEWTKTKTKRDRDRTIELKMKGRVVFLRTQPEMYFDETSEKKLLVRESG